MMQPWAWLLAALGLLSLEVVSGASFVAVFFAAGAALAAGVASVWPDAGPWTTTLTFVAGSVVPLVLARRPLLDWSQRRHASLSVDDDIVGSVARLSQPLAPQASGSGTLRGARWQVRNVGVVALAAEQSVRVVGLAGLTLLVTADVAAGRAGAAARPTGSFPPQGA